MKQVLIVVGKLARSRVLQDGVEFRVAPRERDWARKVSLSYEVKQGWSKTKPYKTRAKTPILWTRPAPLSSLPYMTCTMIEN